MSDSRFDHIYDPVATPNPPYDDDFEHSPEPTTSWNRRDLAQALLHRARARQEAIADAFVDALLDGKIALFRILLELEQAALTSEADAQDARRPGLADILIPMLQRERAAAEAARQASEPAPNHAPEPSRSLPSLVAPADPKESAPPKPGITDIHSAADAPAPRACRSQTVAHNRRRATAHNSPGLRSSRVPQVSILRPGIPGTIPFTLHTLHAVAAPQDEYGIRIPLRFKSYGTRRPRRRISRCKPFKQKELHA